jgi:hypothetical protein
MFVAAAFLQSRPIPCGAGTDDTWVLLLSGRAALAGGDPFQVVSCGRTVPVPYGIVAVGLDALGALGGRVGIWLVWELPTLAVLPLLWTLSPEADRRFRTAFAATSLLYVPLITAQIDGATSAFVVVATLLPLAAAVRGRRGAAGGLAGLLAAVKFPSLVPFGGAVDGPRRGRLAGWLAAAGAFAATLAVGWAIWRGAFVSSVVVSQALRRDYSLNEFGVLLPNGWAPASWIVVALQAGLLLAAFLFVQLRRMPPAVGVGFLLVTLGLVTSFLSASFLCWFLPLVLAGRRATRGLYLLSLLGTADADIGLNLLAWTWGIWWPSEILAAGVTGVLVYLLVELGRRPEFARVITGTEREEDIPGSRSSGPTVLKPVPPP